MSKSHSATHSRIGTLYGPELKILHLLHTFNTPLYAYDELMKLLVSISKDGYEFIPEFPSRKTLLNHVMHTTDKICPKVITTSLEEWNNIDVVIFDFKDMVHSLLTDKFCMKDKCQNLSITFYRLFRGTS